MARSMPSLLALLGLVAVAGFQNRGRIGEMMKEAGAVPGGAGGASPQSGGAVGSGPDTGGVAGALGDLIDRFNRTGQGRMANSWVANGANQPLPQQDLERALGDDTLAELAAKTGLARDDLLHRLAVTLPEAVHQLTPDGRLPAA